MQAPLPKMNIDISKTKDLTCANCDGVYFRRLVRMKYASAIVSPTGEATLIPIEVLVCERCETEFDPDRAVNKAFKDVKEVSADENPSGSIVDLK